MSRRAGDVVTGSATVPEPGRGTEAAGAPRASGMAAELHAVRFRYPGADRDALADVSLSFPAGRHSAVLGPNGAGKSTLLRVVLGILRPRGGSVRLAGLDVAAWSRREIARHVAVVSQDRPPDFPITVRSFVEMGRNPYLRPWRSPGAADHRAVEGALERTDLGRLSGRLLGELSGGELQRAKLARALAQEPRLLLLDEPTAHLDLGHEVQIFELVDGLVREEGLSAIAVTHNLHLASRYADPVALLSGGRVVGRGTAADVLEPERLGRVFGWPVEVVDLGPLGLQVVPRAGADR